ncbi:hypothetical protein [Burkholderia catarinensis]|uniref:hypothetical protein n=1 Tax=Burkholderia catarinensis TaxID=1108140 RepID=UPI001301217D|nr:hypothetical protein [Burkholderia catarinensis]
MERDAAQALRAIHHEQERHAHESVPGRDAALKYTAPIIRHRPLPGLRSAR